VDDFALAAELCDRALAQADDDAPVLAIAAMERHNVRDDGAAGLALAERAVALNPHSLFVVKIAAIVQRQRGRSDSAIGLFERCLRLSPNSPHNAMSVENIGCCHLDAGRFEEAVDWVRRALAMGASWDLALVNLTVAHAMLGQSDEARSALGRFLAVRPGATIRGLMDRLPPGTRRSVEHVWPEGLRRAGLPEG
jgi:adenylate cyclase